MSSTGRKPKQFGRSFMAATEKTKMSGAGRTRNRLFLSREHLQMQLRGGLSTTGFCLWRRTLLESSINKWSNIHLRMLRPLSTFRLGKASRTKGQMWATSKQRQQNFQMSNTQCHVLPFALAANSTCPQMLIFFRLWCIWLNWFWSFCVW